MALAEKTAALAMAIASLQVIQAAVYRVGESSGWTTIGNVDYKKWAATKTFQIGDTILFVYNAQFHNVMRVTHPMYRACNTSAPLATYTTGNDSVTITTHGHHFFFCGVPGHCEAGQKVDIYVHRDNGTSSSRAEPTPPVPSAPGSSNGAMSLKASKGSSFGNIGLAIAAIATFVIGFD